MQYVVCRNAKSFLFHSSSGVPRDMVDWIFKTEDGVREHTCYIVELTACNLEGRREKKEKSDNFSLREQD